MKRIATQFTVPAARTVAAAALLATLALASPARAATGSFSICITAPLCFCTMNVTTLTATANPKNGSFSKTKAKSCGPARD